MGNILHLPTQPKVFNTLALLRLAEANRAVRQLRSLGCQVIRLAIGDCDSATEILVDRNPHRTLAGCPGVHVSVARAI